MHTGLENKERDSRSLITMLDIILQNPKMLQFQRQKDHRLKHLANPNLLTNAMIAVIFLLAIRLYVDTAISNINGVLVKILQLIGQK